MKTKVFNKKLSLNKKTVAHLKNDEMHNSKGGAIPTFYYTCVPTYCRGWTCVAASWCCAITTD